MSIFFERLVSGRKGWFVIYLSFLGAYLGASGGRLRHASQANHFVYLAEGWLNGRMFMNVPPPNENDWGLMEVLKLTDGRTVQGQFRKSGSPDRFHYSKGGSEIIPSETIASRSNKRFVSFPPFPAVLMLLFVAIWKLQLNDVVFNCFWAALNPVLLFALLRRLARNGYSTRRAADDLWLTVLFGAGSVYYYCSVVGQVWYTAHIVGVTMVLVYTWAALDAQKPWLAGLSVALAYCCRPSLAFIFPFFVFEAVRVSGGWAELWQKVKATKALCRNKLRSYRNRGAQLARSEEGAYSSVRNRRATQPDGMDRWRDCTSYFETATKLPPGLISKLLQFAAPAAGILLLVLVYNYARFGGLTLDFGHTYLNIAWKERIERWGLFNYHFLSRNLACALVLMPRILAAYPYVKVCHHGMSLLITSPNLGYLLAPSLRSVLSRGLWLTVLSTALPSLLYQNSGYIQFGYRFSLDYMVFLVVLLSVRGRPITWVFKALVVIAVGINLFGAIIFDRFNQFTYDDSFFPHGFN